MLPSLHWAWPALLKLVNPFVWTPCMNNNDYKDVWHTLKQLNTSACDARKKFLCLKMQIFCLALNVSTIPYQMTHTRIVEISFKLWNLICKLLLPLDWKISKFPLKYSSALEGGTCWSSVRTTRTAGVEISFKFPLRYVNNNFKYYHKMERYE